MKIIFLNCLNGEVYQPLVSFVEKHSKDTDVFCLQEADNKVVDIFQKFIPHFTKLTQSKYILTDRFDLATFIHPKLEVINTDYLLNKTDKVGLGIYSSIKRDGKVLHLCNFHGIAQPGDKLDNPNRLAQSQGIIDYFSSISEPKVIGGDFNLSDQTESVRLFQKNGYLNLIDQYKIPTTRNELAWKLYPPEQKQLFADYIFLDPKITVKSFVVPDYIVSDHQPMLLEIV